MLEVAVAEGKRRLGLPVTYRRRRTPGPPATVRIAVIVPLGNAPDTLLAAVRSALQQEIETGVGIVVVADGPPYESMHRLAQTLADEDPGHVVYLPEPSGGPASARNAGIRCALRRWPQVEAVCPLGTDGPLAQHTLPPLWAVLQGRPDTAWALAAQGSVGALDGERPTAETPLVCRQPFADHQHSGYLVRRSVFEAGVMFDETVPAGCGDWEFLRCGRRTRARRERM